MGSDAHVDRPRARTRLLQRVDANTESRHNSVLSLTPGKASPDGPTKCLMRLLYSPTKPKVRMLVAGSLRTGGDRRAYGAW